MNIHIAAFYQFASEGPRIASETLTEFIAAYEKIGRERQLKGLIIVANEGLNGTISGASREPLEAFLLEMARVLALPPFAVKWSEALAHPFRKFKIRRRAEIVTSGDTSLSALTSETRHLSPSEWQQVLETEDAIVLDTRNWYETDIGKFKNAIDPRLNEFQEWPEYLDKSGLPKDKKILIYCTGGIRCEKAIVEMDRKGFKQVYQLDGGILNYLAQYPEKSFEGECFVFDQRVAVDQNLQPTTTYKFCPHCGQPAAEQLTCLRCDVPTTVCVSCASAEATRTCSKNCAHHYARAPGAKGRNQGLVRLPPRRIAAEPKPGSGPGSGPESEAESRPEQETKACR